MNTATPRLRYVDVGRMLANEPVPIPWAVDPLLIPGELSMIAGREGQGKSMLSQIIGIALADPGALEMIEGVTVHASRVLTVDAENGQPLIHRRLHGAGLRDHTDYLVREAVGLDLRQPEHRGELRQIIDAEKPRVVVLDSLATLAPGVRENEAEVMAPFLLGLQTLARETGVALLLLHHASKAGGYRGSTAIGASVQILVELIAHDGDPDGQRRELVWRKNRPIAKPPPLWLRITSDDGRLAIEAAEPFVPADDGPGVNADARTAAMIANQLETAGTVMTWPDVCAKVGVEPRNGTTLRAMSYGIDHGLFVRPKRGHYAAPTIQLGSMDGSLDETDDQLDPSIQRPRDRGWMDQTRAVGEGQQ